MALMLAGFVLFFGAHSLQILRPVRDGIVGAIGSGPYRGLYSIVSLVGLVLVVRGYNAWQPQAAVLYVPPAGLSHLSLLLMLLAFVILPAAYAPGHIKKTLKHPMLVAVKTWAVAHLLVNGDAASVTLFGTFLAWAVVDRISVKRRERAGLTAPAAFVPSWRADAFAVVIGLIVYALFVWKLHFWLIGVSPLSMTAAA